ncbi:kinase phosphorylation protein-domain-containing protein [Sphaerosporella brunnea]|uniref:Kinase phosphorylation protein-domain-containing protein n=1 Tax=Sphaerosporella brunnea TaxID=1250544 RepID=A0A5J5EMQ5_9PEZI|nr:kinase phosphorylation protein-domain-containing protein [Sphaerosporella brunnea]
MDLLSSLRKGDSSRGGHAEFSWDAVKEDKDRENYLGHSLMAPVGRWQRGKDLTWYAKGETKDSATEEDQRQKEIRRIKQAEEDAIAAALGLPVPNRDNANEAPLGERAGKDEHEGKGSKGGKGREDKGKERSRRHRSRDRDRSRDRERRHRHRSRSRNRDREPRHRDERDMEHKHRDEKDRDRDRDRRRRPEGRKRTRSRDRTRSPRRRRDRESRR